MTMDDNTRIIEHAIFNLEAVVGKHDYTHKPLWGPTDTGSIRIPRDKIEFWGIFKKFACDNLLTNAHTLPPSLSSDSATFFPTYPQPTIKLSDIRIKVATSNFYVISPVINKRTKDSMTK